VAAFRSHIEEGTVAKKKVAPKKPVEDDDIDLSADALLADLNEDARLGRATLARRRVAQAKLAKLLGVDLAAERKARETEHAACVAAARKRAEKLTKEQIKLIGKRTPLMTQIRALTEPREA
jgi:hypothetical protein